MEIKMNELELKLRTSIGEVSGDSKVNALAYVFAEVYKANSDKETHQGALRLSKNTVVEFMAILLELGLGEKMQINKYERDGEIAVLYSPGFGAGWTSWGFGNNEFRDFLLFDKTLVEMAMSESDTEDVEAYINSQFPEEYLYMGGWRDITVAWVPKGTLFKINEYDGSESIELKENSDWVMA
jgi:hypothetical protein